MAGAPGGVGNTNDELLRAVRDAAAGEYEILGEMGRGPSGGVIYLARELATTRLVALRLEPDGDGYTLTVVRQLDASIPAMGSTCARCGAALTGWGRFCAQCGADVGAAAGETRSRQELLDAVRDAAQGEYEILGEMDRAEGGGIVYFARDLATGRIVALRLRKDAAAAEDAGEAYSLGVTQVMKPLVASMGAGYAPPPTGVHASAAGAAAPPIPPPQPAAPDPQPLLGRPTAARPTPQEVLLPADQAPVDETLPPLPPRKAPTLVAGAAAGVVVAVIALVLVVRSRNVPPDGTDARVLPAPAGAGASAPAVARAVDSARIQIAADLPRGARVTVNGTPTPRDTIALPPGTYELAVTAPGYASVREQLRVGAGQLVVWSPALAPARAAERHEVARRPRRAPVRVTADSAPAPAPAPTCASAYDSKDWSTAADLCGREAQAGNIAAERDLAAMYDRGLGVSRDPALASTWYRRAADAGNRDAAYQLALMYDSGRGVPQDARQAAAWFSKAALLGDPAAQFHLAKAYENGTGVEKSTGEAVTWYTKAAQAGNAAAQNYLGWLYGNGKGVPRDDAEALKWFRLAAAQGDAQAQFNVGFMYANGRGVSRDDDQAVQWFRKSAKQGYHDAIEALRDRGLTP